MDYWLILCYFRKKYRKMKYSFDEKMRESNNLFKEEHRAMETARRIQEENDQLLDLLLEINNSSHIPTQHRYDLHSPAMDITATPVVDHDERLQQSYDSTAIQLALEEAKAELVAGEFSEEYYSRLEASILTKASTSSIIALNSMLVTPHTELSILHPDEVPEELYAETPTGYLTPAHEDDYLFALDISLGTSPVLPRQTVPTHPIRLGDKALEKEKDVAVRNPVSVYNWLRKHHPQVFLQDHEGSSEKQSGKSASSRAAKRTSIAPSRTDHEGAEEEHGLPNESGATAKGKKKKDDEPYRPKGGSSRPSKRKREDGEKVDKGGKKVRKIVAAANGA
ncbi:MAG: hypothetical protein M1827_003657 [Pycnora praestabilis]|nr:MAG: hypothetical protein M1827_003657 [Pycnora praestabilis]